MPEFSIVSKKRLSTCHPDLQKLFNEVIKDFDCIILEGHRGEEAQNKAFREGKSKLKYPRSKHNSMPSKAVDVAPYPIDWKDIKRFEQLIQHVLETAKKLGIGIRSGSDWNSNGSSKDEKFLDYPHYELI